MRSPPVLFAWLQGSGFRKAFRFLLGVDVPCHISDRHLLRAPDMVLRNPKNITIPKPIAALLILCHDLLQQRIIQPVLTGSVDLGDQFL